MLFIGSKQNLERAVSNQGVQTTLVSWAEKIGLWQEMKWLEQSETIGIRSVYTTKMQALVARATL